MLTFHANCLHWKQFAQNVKSFFSEKNKKHFIKLLSVELAQRMVSVKIKQRLSLTLQFRSV